jgi:hypothetical protein
MSTNREKFYTRHGVSFTESLSLAQIAKLSNMPLAALKEVEAKGRGAYSSSPQSVRMKGTFKKGVDAPMSQKLSINQWALARVYAFVMKTPSTFGSVDKHIAEKYNLV